MSNVRQLQKEQTRQAILEAARREFERRGFLATRMSDVAAAAGVSHGTVFAHFATQEALVSAVIEAFGLSAARRIHELAAGGGSLREALAAHLAAIGEHEALYTWLVIEARALPPAARDSLAGIQSAISFHIQRAAERELAAGRLRPAPRALLFNTWLGLVHYYLANGDLFAPGGGVVERYGAEWLDYYLNCVKWTGPANDAAPGES